MFPYYSSVQQGYSALIVAMLLLGAFLRIMIMYKTEKWSNKILELEVLKSTDKTVTYMRGERQDRELLVSSYHYWHNTKEDALNHLKQRYLSKIEYAEKEIAEAKKNLELLGV
jgi:hypothetical protein